MRFEFTMREEELDCKKG